MKLFIFMVTFLFCGINYANAGTDPTGSLDEDCRNRVSKFPKGDLNPEEYRTFWCPIDLTNKELHIYVCRKTNSDDLTNSPMELRESVLSNKTNCELANFKIKLRIKN